MVKNVKRIVVKVGSQLLSGSEGINKSFLKSFAYQISETMKAGKEVVVVSSGAVVLGIKALGLNRKPVSLQEKQALSSIGQPYLMSEYQNAFKPYNINVSQVLLTADDLRSKERFMNAKNTFKTLMKFKVLPIVNENDTVSVEEIKIGDNDNLSAHTCVVFEADLLVMLTVTPGIYDKDPSKHANARPIKVVEDIDKLKETCDLKGKTPSGTGGMWTKVEAASKAVEKGIAVVVASGKEDNTILKILNGENPGTIFLPNKKLKAKDYRIIYLMEPKGKVVIDSGAVDAIVKHGKSLLPSGIKKIEGTFEKGDLIEICDIDGKVIARGIVNCDFSKIKSFNKECIHRDNLAILI